MNEHEPQDLIGLAGHGVLRTSRGRRRRSRPSDSALSSTLRWRLTLRLRDTRTIWSIRWTMGSAFEIVKGVLEGPPHALLESLAEECAQRLLDEFPDRASSYTRQQAVRADTGRVGRGVG